MPDESKRVRRKYKKYAPQNLNIKDFKRMVKKDPRLLDDINGKFSTFNPEFAAAIRATNSGNMSHKDLIRKLRSSINRDVMERVVLEHAKMYADIICSNDDLLQATFVFDILGPREREKLGQKIINEMSNRFKFDKKPKVTLFDPHRRIDYIKHFLNGFSVTDCKFLKYYSDRRAFGMLRAKNYRNIVIFNDHFRIFDWFIETLSHEYGHFIDANYPDYGMLGAQVASYNFRFYADEDSLYKLNPTETSSFAIGKKVEEYLIDVLSEQKDKRPELYIQALKKFLPKAKIRLMALRLKHHKEIKLLEEAQKKYMDTVSEILDTVKNDLKTRHPRTESTIKKIEKLISQGNRFDLGWRASYVQYEMSCISDIIDRKYSRILYNAHRNSEDAITDNILTYYLLGYDIANFEENLRKYEKNLLGSVIQKKR